MENVEQESIKYFKIMAMGPPEKPAPTSKEIEKVFKEFFKKHGKES